MRTAGNSVFISERERPEVRVKDKMIVPGRHLGKECYKNQIWIRKADLRGTTRIAQEAFAGCTNLRLVRFKNFEDAGTVCVFGMCPAEGNRISGESGADGRRGVYE